MLSASVSARMPGPNGRGWDVACDGAQWGFTVFAKLD